MGSEHYCLRWNNHQSNLLGVFSQLLQNESLVDVTLACSEGAPIRAHKVVLSACSSYFQSLFLDHPDRHPIVILKDVRLAELQTLVEFMYKGEVNVQYCQLSALLKTAESLKVKGLAEMTNQNTTLREPEREPDRLRPHSQPSKSTCDSPVDAALAGPSTSTASSSSSSASAAAAAAAALSSTGSTATNIAAAAAATGAAGAISATSAISAASTSSASSVSAATAHKRDASDLRCSPTPPKRHQQQTSTSSERDSPLPLDLYQRRATEPLLHEECSSDEQRATRANETNIGAAGSGSSSNAHQQNCSNRPGSAAAATAVGASLSGTSHSHSNNNGGGGGEHEHDLLSSPERPASGSLHGVNAELAGVEKIEEPDDYDEEMDLEDEEGDNSSNEVGLNMKMGSSSMSLVGHHSAPATVVIPSPLGGLGGTSGSGTVGLCDLESARSTPATATHTSSASGIPSDLTQRPASRSSRDGGGVGGGVHIASTDRPSSSGILPASASAIVGGMSPSSSPTAAAVAAAAAAAAGALSSEALSGPSGLGPVQSVPLSLKKEIDCSEDDNSNSRHHMQPRSASAGGGLGGDLDYRASHESETSESPHGGGGGGGVGVGGSGSLGTAAGGSGGCIAIATSASSSSAAAHEQQSQQQQPQTPPPMYPCVYCGAVFPHQSKLTRHILSHSLKTLEYRETTTHALLHSHLLPHDLNMAPLSQQFAYQMNAAAAAADAQEQAAAVAAAAAAAMEMDFVSAMAAASGCSAAALTNITSCGGRGLVDLDGGGDRDRGGSCDRGDRDDRGRGGGGSSSGNGGIGCSSSSGGLILSGTGGSSTSAAAAAAAASASSSLLGSAGSSGGGGGGGGGGGIGDPNSIVLCKFCGKSFPDVATLITHLPVHTGDRPFKCEFCGKAFKLRHHMKDHCRVHTGERPFRCHMCGKTFSRSTILKAHEKTHFPKYVRKYLSPSPVDTKDELPQ